MAQASTSFVADVEIVFGSRDLPGRVVEPLVELDMFPVCAPSYAGKWPHATLGALREATLVHEDDGALWTAWFEATATEQFRARREVYAGTTHDALALSAAGGGVAIDDDFMGSEMLASGALVRPFGERSFRYGRYSVATLPEERASLPAVAFREWIGRKARAAGSC